MLLFAHKGMELNFTPMTNRVHMNDEQKELVSVPQRALYLNTDAFLMLSGLLISYSFIGRLQRGRKIEIIKEIAGRYFRLVPPMAALMIFGTFIFPLIGSGPQWNMLVTYQSELCKRTWWRNFLMIHNWFGFENICMTHMHHIGSDFELFIASIFVIIFLHNSPKYGTIAILILACASTAANFVVSFTTRISAYVLYGVELVALHKLFKIFVTFYLFFSISKLYDAANHLYILPVYRFSVYAIGIYLGYRLRKHKNKKLTDTQVFLGWSLAGSMLVITCAISIANQEYSPLMAACFNALAPVVWCFYFAWFIYVAQAGHKSKKL